MFRSIAAWALRSPGVRRERLRLFAPAAAVVAACLASVVATWLVLRAADERSQVERDVLSAHIRSLLQDRPVQVASSDIHMVKPWFAGRIEFAPAVADLAANGFPLAGGRVDFVGGRRVAGLVYHRRRHVVTVFMWPADGAQDGRPASLKASGYNLLTWRKAGMTYWAASDLNEAEMRAFQSLL